MQDTSKDFFVVSGNAILCGYSLTTGTSWTLVPSQGMRMTMKEACHFVLSTPEHLNYRIAAVDSFKA